jgi:WXG100 family type VII secretion target
MSYATDNSGIMQYSPGHIEALLGELQGFKTALTTSQGDANSADTAITNVWKGASAQAYHTAFSAVSRNLDDVINVLQQGISGVEQAHGNAQTTDKKVMTMFNGG